MPTKDRRIGRFGSNAKIEMLSDTCIDLGIFKVYKFTTAITTTVTTVPDGTVAGYPVAAVGDFAVTSHATGDESLFRNIGGVWVAV